MNYLQRKSVFPLAALSLVPALTVALNYQAAQPSPSSASVATMLPFDVPLIGLVNTKVQAWGTLGRFQLFQTAYAEVTQFVPPSVQFDYAKDVKSWLGDQVAVVMMPKVSSKEEVTLDSSFLMLAAVKDESRLQPFLDKLKSDKRQRMLERQYKGITILEWKPPAPTLPRQPTPSLAQKPKQPSSQLQGNFLTNSFGQVANLPKPNGLKKEPGLAIAVLPGYIVTANTAKPIEQLIDTPKGSKTLAQNPHFQRTIQQPQASQALFTLYEDPAKFIPLIKSLSKDPSLPFPVFVPQISSEKLKEYSTLDAFLLVQPEGLRFQLNAHRQKPRADQANVLTPQTSQNLAWIPASTYSVATGRNLKQEWQTLVAAFSADPKLKDGLTKFRNSVGTGTGLDIDRDIIGWMDGEYAFFLYPTKGGPFNFVGPKFNLGIGFLVQTSNRSAAEATLKKLYQPVKSFSNGSVAVASRSIKGKLVSSWEVKAGKSSQSLFAYSWVNKNTLLVTTGFGAMADLVPQPYLSLPKSYTFASATSSLPQPNKGYFYMNMGSFLSWVYGFLPPQFNFDPNVRKFKQLTGTIRSLSSTISMTPEREQYDYLVVLASARK